MDPSFSTLNSQRAPETVYPASSFVPLPTLIQMPSSAAFYDPVLKKFTHILIADIPSKIGDGCQIFSDGTWAFPSGEINENALQKICALVAEDNIEILKYLVNFFPTKDSFIQAVEKFAKQNIRKLYFTYNEHVGYGVNALETIKRGEIVAFYGGSMRLNRNVTDFSYAYNMKANYTFCIDAKQVRSFGAMFQTAPALACAFTTSFPLEQDQQIASANVTGISLLLHGIPVTAVVAIRKIPKDIPIFIDYIAKDDFTISDYWKFKGMAPFPLNAVTGDPFIHASTGKVIQLREFTDYELLVKYLYNLIENGQFLNAVAIFQKHKLMQNYAVFPLEKRRSYHKLQIYLKQFLFLPQSLDLLTHIRDVLTQLKKAKQATDKLEFALLEQEHKNMGTLMIKVEQFSTKILPESRKDFPQLEQYYVYLKNLFEQRFVSPIRPEIISFFIQRLFLEKGELLKFTDRDFTMLAAGYFMCGTIYAEKCTKNNSVEDAEFLNISKTYIKASIAILQNQDLSIPENYKISNSAL